MNDAISLPVEETGKIVLPSQRQWNGIGAKVRCLLSGGCYMKWKRQHTQTNRRGRAPGQAEAAYPNMLLEPGNRFLCRLWK